MKILVGCEESQTVTLAFRKLGFEAYSCDIQNCSGGFPEWHYQDDIFNVVKIIKPTLLIAHPPCTFLSVAGAWALNPKDKPFNEERFFEGLKAAKFFMDLYNLNINHIALENPTFIKMFNLPVPSQVIQPHYFGDPFTKRTCLWLKNLPKLYWNKSINLFDDKITFVDPIDSWCPNSFKKSLGGASLLKGNVKRARSKTFDGIANAMAEQWGNYLKQQYL